MLYAPASIAITLAAFVLRLVMLDSFPFREDEAAYAYWALHGWLNDPMFLHVWPDKPPIYLWLLGGAFRLFGAGEASARWVNVAASTLLIPVVAATARRIWGRRAALVAAIMMACSPYAISFGPTAFTDPLLVLAGTAAFCAAVYGRSIAAGILFGVAVMTKQQGVIFLPLVLGGLWLASAHVRPAISPHRKRALRQGSLFVAGTALVVLPIVVWDSLRWSVAPSPWDLGVRNYASLSVLSPAQWPSRLSAWGPLLWELTASWAVWAALFGLVMGAVVAQGGTVKARRDDAILLIGGWSAVFLLAHVVTTVQPWDRYLLPLAPMIAFCAAWAVDRLGRTLPGSQTAVAAIAALLLLTTPALQAATGRLSAGGDHGDYAGLTEAIQAVQAANQGRFILYHQVLGTHYRFYLYERTSDTERDDAIDLRWFPSAVYLADNAAKMPYPRKFLIEPEWAPLPNLGPHLAMRNLALEEAGRYGRFTVWEIRHGPSSPCDRCASRTASPWRELAGTSPHGSITLR